MPENSTNIESIHDPAYISAIEKILALPVNSTVYASPIFLYRIASDPLSQLHDSSADIVTPKGKPKPLDNPPNPVPYVQFDLDSNPSPSDYSFSDSSDSLYD